MVIRARVRARLLGLPLLMLTARIIVESQENHVLVVRTAGPVGTRRPGLSLLRRLSWNRRPAPPGSPSPSPSPPRAARRRPAAPAVRRSRSGAPAWRAPASWSARTRAS